MTGGVLIDLPLYGFVDRLGLMWRLGSAPEANQLLRRSHYLGPIRTAALVVVGDSGGQIVACQAWKLPTSRRLPSDGSWLELARWCLTPAAGDNAGSRMHRWALRLIRTHAAEVTTLLSYSDPSAGHSGALYRACNWQWAPPWQRLRPPPSGSGDWGTGRQEVKDRWVYPLRPDPNRDSYLHVDDRGAVAYWEKHGTDAEKEWARRSVLTNIGKGTRL